MPRYLRFIADDLPDAVAFGRMETEDAIRLLDRSPLEGGRDTDRTLPLSAVRRWLPPVDPPDVIAIGANYVDHCAESKVAPPANPLVFLKARSSVIGHREPIVLPRQHPQEVDYEAELALVIGRTARHVSRDRALEYVFGVTCANDVSARDCQLRIDKQWARGKSFDTFCPLGPYLVTGLDPSALRLRLRLNGEVLQDQPTRDMIFPVPILIEHLSAGMTLHPGTVILTGTPCGVGMARTPPRFLRPGDAAQVEIGGVGVLENPVRAE